ncbi:MAG: GTP-binding protein [Cyanobacteria bacterium P01_D01_bin.123]
MADLTTDTAKSVRQGHCSDRHYVARARRSLLQLLHDVQFAPDEREFFADDIEALQRAIAKLERGRLTVAIFGMVGRGKSAMANALLRRDDFAMAPIHGTTRSPQRSAWETYTPSAALESATPTIRQVEIVDTPGLNDVDGSARDRLARQTARQADLILFVLAGDITAAEHQALSELRLVNKPILLAFNKIDLYPDRDRQAIYASLTSPKLRQLIAPEDIALTAARPKPEPIEVHWPDGRVEETWEQPEPHIDDLEAKLQSIVARDGLSLIALNALLFADDWRDRVVKKKVRLRDLRVQTAIWQYAGWKAIAVAFNPIPVLDILGAMAADLGLVTAVSRQYGLGLTRSGSGRVLAQLLMGWGSYVAIELWSMLGSGFSIAPLGAALVGGGFDAGSDLASYGGAALLQASAAGLTAYLMGRVTREALQQSDGRDADSPKQVLTSLLASLRPSSALYRLREDIRIARGTATSTQQRSMFSSKFGRRFWNRKSALQD